MCVVCPHYISCWLFWLIYRYNLTVRRYSPSSDWLIDFIRNSCWILLNVLSASMEMNKFSPWFVNIVNYMEGFFILNNPHIPEIHTPWSCLILFVKILFHILHWYLFLYFVFYISVFFVDIFTPNYHCICSIKNDFRKFSFVYMVWNCLNSFLALPNLYLCVLFIEVTEWWHGEVIAIERIYCLHVLREGGMPCHTGKHHIWSGGRSRSEGKK